jgi:hypothetical protein
MLSSSSAIVTSDLAFSTFSAGVVQPVVIMMIEVNKINPDDLINWLITVF